MTEFPDNALCVFHAIVEETDDTYTLEVPKNEIAVGDVEPDDRYRVALLPPAVAASLRSDRSRSQDREPDQPEPPVSESEERTVDIENIGEQGDGIARVERGYVIVVPDTEKGERVTIEITAVTSNVGFGEVLSREDYYE